MTFFEDLQWRGLVGQTIGNVEELLKTPTTFYCGFDPTSISKDNLNPKYPEITSSLHIGHLLALITCKRFQMNGHKPIMLVGGFTGLVGDGSFRTEDRQLLSVSEVENNIKCISKQIKHLIDFSDDKAIFVNNAEWLDGFSLIDFLRGVGKSVSLNYLISKDSVRNRLEREGCGISLCEALYGPLQGYDFVHLNQKYGCKLSVNGTDQIGNATYSTIIGKKLCGIESDNFNVLAWPLVTKADGSKFGKSMSGKCIWLDKHLTSVYDFYQFWLNQSDEDAKKFIKLFTLLSKEEIEHLTEEHDKAPHNRLLQKRLAEEVTIMVHSKEECDKVISASNVLFGGGSIDTFKGLDDDTIMSIFDGCPIHSISKEIIGDGIKLISLCTDIAPLFQSKGDLRKLIKNNGISVNKEKVSDTDLVITMDNFINDKFLIVQQGKKNYNLIYID